MEINENLILNFRGENFPIKFPRVGEYRNIEVMKQTLSGNVYGGMARSMTSAAEEALDMIDMESYFTVLCPDLFKKLKCDSFSELGLVDYTEIRKVFKKNFVPWWQSIEKLLRPEPIKREVKDEEPITE